MGYTDPGLFGILSQVGVVIFLFVVTAFTFFSKKVKDTFKKIFKIKTEDENSKKD